MTYKHVDKVAERPELVRLKDLQKPPKRLYYQGSWNPGLFDHCATVVGSRRMSAYGRQVIDRLVPQLVRTGKTIVSGFMYGVDQYAHQVCMESGGRTIAVLGWGITKPLDGDDARLARAIIDHSGVLVSEWEVQEGTLWTFPVRDRIVAALSADVYIVEAALKSGSLITAEAAWQLQRNVWAVPGPITSSTSAGTNLLISEKKADVWLGGADQPVSEAKPVQPAAAGSG